MAAAQPLPGRGASVALPRDDDLWAPTRTQTAMATQLMGDREAYLDNAARDIGRRLSEDQHELFVVCEPADALRQQFEHRAPEFIVLHDLGGDASLRLLQGVASAAGTKLQTLVIRRQGFGDVLATLAFVELPAPRGKPAVRVYSTRGDTPRHPALARALLGCCRLGAVLAEAPPDGAAGHDLHWLQQAQLDPGWRNRHLLWLPLAAAAQRPSADPSGPRLHALPPLAGLAQAWPLISEAWNQLRNAGELSAPSRPAAPVAPAPLPMRPMPAVSAASAGTTAAAAPAPRSESAGPETSPWAAYVQACAEMAGLLSCCVFELATERPLAHAGRRPGPASLAAHGAELHTAMLQLARSMGLPPGRPDVSVNLAEHLLLLHPLPNHPGLALHAVLDAQVANLALVRMKLHRLDPPAD